MFKMYKSPAIARISSYFKINSASIEAVLGDINLLAKQLIVI